VRDEDPERGLALKCSDNKICAGTLTIVMYGKSASGAMSKGTVLAVEYSGAYPRHDSRVASERHWLGPFSRCAAFAACAVFWVEIIRLAAYSL